MSRLVIEESVAKLLAGEELLRVSFRPKRDLLESGVAVHAWADAVEHLDDVTSSIIASELNHAIGPILRRHSAALQQAAIEDLSDDLTKLAGDGR